MKRLYVIFALVAVSTAQKHPKNGKHGKYVASSPGPTGGGGDDYGQSQYHAPLAYQNQPKSHHNNGGHHQGGAPESKQPHSQLLSDTRTLNHDGTINFNYQADNGLQQGESTDADGTRRGFYSYPGADGKQITVKYTAGKNGFIAEGDHLPLQPQAAVHSEKDGGQYSPKEEDRNGRQRDSGQYNPPYNSRPSPSYNHKPAAPAPKHNSGRYQGGPASGPSNDGSYSNSFGDDGDDGSYHHQDGSGESGFSQGPQQSYNSYSSPKSPPPKAPAPRPSYSGSGRFPGGGSGPSYSHYSGGPSFGSSNNGPSYSSGAPSGGPRPSYNRGGGGGGNGGFTADNPYQPSGAGAYNGKFDLGNNGHFSIDFTPGAQQEYNPGGQGSSHTPHYSPQHAPIYVGPRPGGRRAPHGVRGQY